MEDLLTELAVSMSDFKRNPAKVLRDAGIQPVAVLEHDKPAFYMIAPAVFAMLLEQLSDQASMPLLLARLAQREQAIEVDIDTV